MLHAHLRGALAAFALALALPGAAAGAGLRLHVPSPDWRDQVIYFVVTDRFADGDPSNNDQGAGEFRAGDPNRYNGGDLAGLVQQLPYIRGLGATALWITPPVANQWLDPTGQHAGYHGYWAENFIRVDRHLGGLAGYRRLSNALHKAGMYLVQDIVVNHTGNYFTYRDRWTPGDAAQGWEAHDATPPVPRPSQPPFDRNDPRDPAQRRLGIYHWTPDITDYNDRQQELNFQMSGLDDLNTENAVVRRALRRSYGHWIREVGVDAFRIDTAFYVPPEFFADFMAARDAQAPGMVEVARRTGRTNFLVFGEGFGIERPGEDVQARKLESYMTGEGGRPLLPGMLNFPLYGALGAVFARGRPPAELAQAIEATMSLHARPQLMPTFVDNHDVDRFLAGGSQAGLRQALLALMTLPGIPVIYYGTEQGFTASRAAMFKAGWGSGGRDHYDRTAPLYRAIAEMTALRRSHRVFSRGTPALLQANAAQPGALAWRMTQGREQAFVVFNTADAQALLANLDTGLAAGTVLEGLYGLAGRPADLVVGTGGRLSLRLPPHSGQVWRATEQRRAFAVPPARLVLDAGPATAQGAPRDGDFHVTGHASGVERALLVVDGDLGGARGIVPGPDGRWQAPVDTSRMVDPATPHSLVAWAEGRATSETLDFRVVRSWQELADVPDPAGDDAGPTGRYLYPTDPGWGAHRQMDLRRVRAWGSGGALRLELTMKEITRSWNPANGFDHVAFTVFIERPGAPGGATVMPLQNAHLPEGMRWHLRLRAHGWSNALFSSAGASATQEGTPVTPAAAIAVDATKGTVTFTLPASVLGAGRSLAGAKVYVTTWDYDAGYRSLEPQAQPFAIGGGSAQGAKVMDDSAVITLR